MNKKNESFKPTPGPWKYTATWANSCQEVYSCEGRQLAVLLPMSQGGIEGQSNAALIAEAGTVYHETGKTPSQLADENRVLLAALVECETVVSENYDLVFSTNPAVRYCDALKAVREIRERARAAIQNAKGV